MKHKRYIVFAWCCYDPTKSLKNIIKDTFDSLEDAKECADSCYDNGDGYDTVYVYDRIEGMEVYKLDE